MRRGRSSGGQASLPASRRARGAASAQRVRREEGGEEEQARERHRERGGLIPDEMMSHQKMRKRRLIGEFG